MWCLRASEEIVHAQHLAAKLQKSLGEMRAEKSRAAGNENASFKMLHCRPVRSDALTCGCCSTLMVEQVSAYPLPI